MTTITLLIVGMARGNLSAFLYLNAVWLLTAVPAANVSYSCWQERGASGNWLILAVMFGVWPYAILVAISGIAVLFFIRGNRGSSVKAVRIATFGNIGIALLLSLWGALGAN